MCSMHARVVVYCLDSEALFVGPLCSMPSEYGPLMDGISELDWATEAFDGQPEATNLWIGGDRSTTSFHKAGAQHHVPSITIRLAAMMWGSILMIGELSRQPWKS